MDSAVTMAVGAMVMGLTMAVSGQFTGATSVQAPPVPHVLPPPPPGQPPAPPPR
ncbi:MAG: hypothetical protein ACXV9R_06465 [Methylobacter sp.]